MSIGSMVGKMLFPQYHEQFGFTEVTGIDMLGEARVTPSLYHTASAITAVDVATSSIGQTFKVTPIQMITGVCAVAGDGQLRRPFVAARVISPDNQTVIQNKPTVRRRVISEDTAKRISTLLEGVVDGGGAKNAYVAGYRVAGKTGTSEKTDQAAGANGRKNVVASFCGFAPADNPRVAVIVMIDEPQTYIRYGGTLAAPVAQKIFADVLPYLGVSPQYKVQEQAEWQVTMPQVVGKTTAEAVQLLQGLGLSCRTVGQGTVTVQRPTAGEQLLKGGTAVVYTDQTEAESATVPAVVGKTLSEANKLLIDSGLNVKICGWTATVENVNVTRQAVISVQNIPSGSVVPRGTVVEVTVLYQDAIE